MLDTVKQAHLRFRLLFGLMPPFNFTSISIDDNEFIITSPYPVWHGNLLNVLFPLLPGASGLVASFRQPPPERMVYRGHDPVRLSAT